MEPHEKISELRKLMNKHRLDAWIVPSADPHQGEYPAERWKARAWLSGFKGSAGTLVVTRDQAGLWIDSRYHIRAAKELEGSGIDLYKFGVVGVPSYIQWLRSELPAGSVIGCDGNVLSIAELSNLEKEFQGRGISFDLQYDLVGELWHDRPEVPGNQIFIHEDKFAGESRASKIQRIRSRLRELDADMHVVTALDDIAWILNIRGSDVAFNPVAICYLIISHQEIRLFIEARKVANAVKQVLERDGVLFSKYEDVNEYLHTLKSEVNILVDPERTNYSLRNAIPETCPVKYGTSVPHIMKAIKNETERAGIKQSQTRDGVAMVKWMYWLDQQVDKSAHTEITVAEKLSEFRSVGEYFQGLSFGTICGYKANSAIGHYSSNPLTAPSLGNDGILLIDSGGQYLDGTTDITRTITLGNPTPEEKQAFTTVLKCHIKLAAQIFPRGTRGYQLDAIARQPLWVRGWDCRHGIGHGVGYFLNVHEGPQRFRADSSILFEPHMLTSNEPGVYFEGRFGVRLESLLLTVPKESTEFGEFYGFETVTLCPIDLELVERSLLTSEEIDWLNSYHRGVNDKLSPFLSMEEQAWLQHETRQI